MATNIAGAGTSLGRVHPKLSVPSYHCFNTLSLHNRLSVSLVRRSIGGSSCQPLVPGEREGLGLSTRPPAKGSKKAQESELKHPSTNLVKRSGSPPGIYASGCPAASWVPDTSDHLPKSDQPSYLPPWLTFTIHNFTYLLCVSLKTSQPSLLPSPQGLTQLMCLFLLSNWKTTSFRYTLSSTQDEAASCNTYWLGGLWSRGEIFDIMWQCSWFYPAQY